MIKVTSGYERFVHWMLAISCLLLCYTGLGMMYKELNFFGAIMGGLHGLKVVHNYYRYCFRRFTCSGHTDVVERSGAFCFSGRSGMDQGRGRLSVACG